MGTNEFQVLKAMNMKNASRYLTPYSLVDGYQRISGSHGDDYEECLPLSDAV
jgi:hypothetical protein